MRAVCDEDGRRRAVEIVKPHTAVRCARLDWARDELVAAVWFESENTAYALARRRLAADAIVADCVPNAGALSAHLETTSRSAAEKKRHLRRRRDHALQMRGRVALGLIHDSEVAVGHGCGSEVARQVADHRRCGFGVHRDVLRRG